MSRGDCKLGSSKTGEGTANEDIGWDQTEFTVAPGRPLRPPCR